MSKTDQATDSNHPNRRELLKRGGALAGGLSVVTFTPLGCEGGGRVAVARGQNARAEQANFLNEAEMATLNALVARMIPADADPGGAEAGCTDAINILLSAFSFEPPMIFAGGPFSDRGGAAHNDFEDFIPLDSYEELAWRIKIEGSKGLPEREFNGPQRGWQSIYKEGLARLDERAAEYSVGAFADLPAPAQELIMRDSSDGLIQDLINVAFPQSLEAMYGPPEYGGNRELVGWTNTGFEGDVQPRGYTNEEVTEPDNPGLFDLLPGPRPASPPAGALLPVPNAQEQQAIQQALSNLVLSHSGEMTLGLMMKGNSSLRDLQQEVRGWKQANSKGGENNG